MDDELIDVLVLDVLTLDVLVIDMLVLDMVAVDEVVPWMRMRMFNVGITIAKHPFVNGSYQLSMVIWDMVYYCYIHFTKVCAWIGWMDR